MSQTITFREMVKMIHPDHNPSITDAGGKMRTVILYKNEPVELYKLAVRWGLLGKKRPEPARPRPTIRPAPRSTPRQSRTWTTPPRPKYDWLAYFNEEPEVEGFVCVRTLENSRVKVVRVTPKRVYFYYNGRRTFASRKNIYVVKWVQVN
jgi:hypothetical protein